MTRDAVIRSDLFHPLVGRQERHRFLLLVEHDNDVGPCNRLGCRL
jgi:hypothetical protein